MDLKLRIIKITVVLFVVPLLSFGQYFQGLYDNDSLDDWGWCLLNRIDSNYFAVGWSFNETTNQFSMFDVVSNAAGTILSQRDIIESYNVNVGPGNPGQIIQSGDNFYLIPLYMQWLNGTSLYSAGGLMKMSDGGDTIFLRTYTDTSLYYDYMHCCAIMPNKDYVVGGARGRNYPSNYPGLLIRTDSLGDTIWTHTYQYDTAQWVTIDNVIPLPDGRIVLGATTTYTVVDDFDSGDLVYYHSTPWFLVLDSLGHILRDTLYGSNYVVGNVSICNNLYPDANGGYIHIGVYDSVFSTWTTEVQNFPAYVAHLDTNFRITWITEFNYSENYGHQQACTVRQLSDSSYVLAGETAIYQAPYTMGFAAHLSRNGTILWRNNYYSDTTQFAYLRDVAERPDGSLLFTGSTFNDTLPAWRIRDMWLPGVDSNGCQIPGCSITEVKSAPVMNTQELKVYPNPTSGNLTVGAPGSGILTLYTIVGQQVQSYLIEAGKTNVTLPVNITPGIYMVVYKPDSGGAAKEVKVIYQSQ